jgi:hypothetical protein
MAIGKGALKLPDWAEVSGSHGQLDVIKVNTHDAFPWIWDQLRKVCKQGEPECPPERPEEDDYWLEVAYQCIKLELQRCVGHFTFEIHMKDPGKKWRQSNPNGERARAAAQGRGARRCFARFRGSVPGAASP